MRFNVNEFLAKIAASFLLSKVSSCELFVFPVLDKGRYNVVPPDIQSIQIVQQ